jgi:predicted phage-related endonuclease
MVYPEATHQYLVCFGNLKLVWWEVPFHQRAMDRLVREEERFLERIVKRDAPPVRAADAAVLAKAWPIAKAEAIELPDDLMWIARNYDRLAVSLKTDSAVSDHCEAEMKAALGEHEEGVFSDGSRITWKSHTRKGYTVAESIVRRFDRRAAKGETNGQE